MWRTWTVCNVNPAIILKNTWGGKYCCLTADETRGASKSMILWTILKLRLLCLLAKFANVYTVLLFFFFSDWSKNLTQKLYTIISQSYSEIINHCDWTPSKSAEKSNKYHLTETRLYFFSKVLGNNLHNNIDT